VEKLYSLPGTIILGLDAVRTNLEQALGRPDIPQDLQVNLTKLCEALGTFIQDAREAQKELDPTYSSE
jgi:hypothetical protein